VSLPKTVNEASTSQPGRVYDRHYRGGGFRYERMRPKWEAWVKRHYVREFGLVPGERVLDIPCGDGFWSSVLRDAGFDVVGADASAGGIDVASTTYPGIEFVVADAEHELPFPNGRFDVVFCRGISHFHRRELFTDSTARMLDNLMRYVRPGGLLLISYYSRRDRSGTDAHYQHPLADLVKAVEPHGDIFKVDVVDDFVQIGVQHRDAPRKRSTRVWQRAMGTRARRLTHRVTRRLISSRRRRQSAGY
jgi:SAM-dependent methyltransferase